MSDKPTSYMNHNAGESPHNTDENMTMEKWKSIAEKLWCLLDDIDTASDMFKPEMNNFYKYTMDKVERRFKLIGSDGYVLFPLQLEKKGEA